MPRKQLATWKQSMPPSEYNDLVISMEYTMRMTVMEVYKQYKVPRKLMQKALKGHHAAMTINTLIEKVTKEIDTDVYDDYDDEITW